MQTFFFSTSGGRTESIEKVWPGSRAVPYFTSVTDPYESASAPRHVWAAKDTKLLYASVLRAKLKAAGLPVPGTLRDVVVTRRGRSGRVVTIVLKGAAGDDRTLPLASVTRFKSALGLWGTWFYVTRSGVSAPRVVMYGVPFSVGLVTVPALTGHVAVRFGPYSSAALPRSVIGTIARGRGSVRLPGLTYASDVAVSSGSVGTGGLFRSTRVRVTVCRRLALSAGASGSRADSHRDGHAVQGGHPGVLRGAPPGSTRWRAAGQAKCSGKGVATLTWTPPSKGTWRFRARNAGGGGFVAGYSRTVAATVPAK